jgi:hypothetical protein
MEIGDRSVCPQFLEKSHRVNFSFSRSNESAYFLITFRFSNRFICP